jgi:hypothetical protein
MLVADRALTPVTFRSSTAQVLVGHLIVATDREVVITCGGLPKLTAQEFVALVTHRTDPRLADAEAVVLAVIAEVLDAAGRAVGALDEAVEEHLRHELPVHARAHLTAGLPRGAAGHAQRVRHALPPVPPERLAVAAEATTDPSEPRGSAGTCPTVLPAG